MEQWRLLAYHYADGKHILCKWTVRTHKHQMCRQFQYPKGTMSINKAGTSSLISEHQAQYHPQVAVPSSDSTTVTTVMMQIVQVPPLQTNQINSNNQIGVWMNTQVGIAFAPSAGVSFSQTQVCIKDCMLLDSQSCIDYFTNPSPVNDVHDSKESLMLSTSSGQSIAKHKANLPK